MALIITLLYFTNSIGQDFEIRTADLVGYWTFDTTVEQDGMNIIFYKRCDYNFKGTVLQFMPSGKFKIDHKNSKMIPSKCGNISRTRDIRGSFHYNPDLQTIRLNNYSPKTRAIWNLKYIDKNSFGVEKTHSR